MCQLKKALRFQKTRSFEFLARSLCFMLIDLDVSAKIQLQSSAYLSSVTFPTLCNSKPWSVLYSRCFVGHSALAEHLIVFKMVLFVFVFGKATTMPLDSVTSSLAIEIIH